MSSPLALVTGVSGYLGPHVVYALLKDGYRVRGTVRSVKVDFVKQNFAEVGDRVEIVGVNNIATDDFSGVLKGVSAIVHVAAPMPGTHSAEDSLNFAIEGTLNLARQAAQAGIKKFVAVSSINTVVGQVHRTDGGGLFTANDWNTSVTREDALKPGAHPFVIIYAAEKILTEKALWAFGAEHPDIEIASVNPSFFIGPMAPGWRTEKPRMRALSTGFLIYNLLHPDAPLADKPLVIDVRDVARACALALKAPPTSVVGQKRFPLSGSFLPYKEVIEYIAHERPELAARLNKAAASSGQAPLQIIDNSRAEAVLGLEFTPWKKTVLDSVDYLVELEKDWLSKGWEPTKEFVRV